MTVRCEEFEYCKVRVNYIADADLVQEKRDEVLEAVKKMNVKVPGFRQNLKRKNTKRKKKGSFSSSKMKDSLAYEKALKKTYKKYIDEQVQRELVAEAYDEVMHETKMKPVGYPQISGQELDEDTFECEMIFLKKPDFELKQYKGFEVPQPHQEETAIARAEKMIQMLRERHGETTLYGEDDFLQDGDNVTLNVKSTCEGKEIESLTQEGMPYTVGSNTFEEFDHNLYGMKPDETRKFDIVFPGGEEINEEIRDKRVTFTVTLLAGTKLVLCGLDDDFAEKLGFKTFQEMHNDAVGTASAHIERERRQLLANQVLKRILEAHDFEVPQWLILMESQQAVAQMGVKWDDMKEEEIDQLNKQSINKIKMSMILDSIRDEEPEAVFSEEEIINKMRANIQMNGGDPDEVLSSAQKEGTLFGLVAKLKDEGTIQWLIEQNTIIDEEVADGKAKEKEGTVDSGVSGQVGEEASG